MKKLILTCLFFMGAGYLLADVFPGGGEISKGFPRPDINTNESVYWSSYTCNASNLQTVFISSPYPTFLYSIKVSSPGTGGSYVDVFDGLASTALARRVDTFNSMIQMQHFYNIATSSWMGVSNQNGPSGTGFAACIDIIYRVR